MLFVSFLRHSLSLFPEGNLVYIIIYTGIAVTPCQFLAEDASVGCLSCSIYVRSASGTAVDAEDTSVHQYQLMYYVRGQTTIGNARQSSGRTASLNYTWCVICAMSYDKTGPWYSVPWLKALPGLPVYRIFATHNSASNHSVNSCKCPAPQPCYAWAPWTPTATIIYSVCLFSSSLELTPT